MEKDHKQMLKGQIIEAREQRATSKRLHVEQASTHDFPDFTKPTDISVQDYVVERKMHLKDDLDQQVNLKRRQKEQRKALEHELDRINNLACHRDLAQQKLRERDKGRQALQECLQSWEDTKRIREAQKAIHEFKKRPSASRSGLVDMLTGLRTSEGSLSARERTPMSSLQVQDAPLTDRARHVHLPEVPATPSDLSIPLSSRPTTGSVRRFPISAAANLALTKQRLKDRGMM